MTQRIYSSRNTFRTMLKIADDMLITLRAENEKLRAENGLLMAENRTESERLKEACDGYLGHAAGLRDEVGRLNERIRFADQEFAAECAGLRGENARLWEALEKIAEAPVNWSSLNPHDYARLVGKFQLDAEAALQSKGQTPCDVTHTKRWGWWCLSHNKPAYPSHDGDYYCARAALQSKGE
jgi:hypothetical protein